MSVQPSVRMKRRLNIVVVLILAVFTVYIFLNLFRSSVLDSRMYQAMANNNQLGSITLHANRGGIYDRNGKILAQSATVFDVVLDPKTLLDNCKVKDDSEQGYYIDQEQWDHLVDYLASKLNLDREIVEKKASKTEGAGSRYQTIKEKVEKPLADEIVAYADNAKDEHGNRPNKHTYTCVMPVANTKRYYPQGDLAAPVIGFVGADGGQYGLEAKYDDYLAGVDGRIVSAKDANQNAIPYKYATTFDAQEGNSLVLTLDTTLQHYLEKHLKSTVSKYQAQNRACGIIMNAKTGAILAMATEPDFDLNEPAVIYDANIAAQLAAMPQNTDEEKKVYQDAYAASREQQWKNKAITELYYPGSVFKVFTGSAALEEKVITASERTWTCHPMLLPGMSSPFNCWKNNAHGTQNFAESMTNSCNPAFIQIGQRLGIHKFSEYYAAYGFTEGTGIDLPGEMKTSLYYTEEQMGPVELASSSFGQTNKVTPIQMITAYAAAVNGGNLVTPYVVSKIKDASGNVVKTIEPNIRRQVISEETSAIMRETLEYVVSTKGGSNAYIEGYRIGGKSGTSQKQEENIKQNREDLYVASYVGFAPADDPEVIMLVMVDTPSTGEYYGSIIAAPVVKDVLEEALPYLGYYPEYTAEQLEEMDVSVPIVEGMPLEEAKSKLTESDLNYEVIGTGDNVQAQVPSQGNSIPRKGRVILYLDPEYQEETVIVPDMVTGQLNLDAVNQLLTNRHLNVKASGASKRKDAVATSQSIPAGSVVEKGTIVEVYFAVHDQTG